MAGENCGPVHINNLTVRFVTTEAYPPLQHLGIVILQGLPR
jgi:hypothetical protein